MLVMVILTSGTTAPVESVTVPTRVPREVPCPKSAAGRNNTRTAKVTTQYNSKRPLRNIQHYLPP